MGKVLLLLQILPLLVYGHGNMVFPYIWMDSEEIGVWHGGFKEGGIGCGSITSPGGYPTESHLGCLATWFTNNTREPINNRTPWHAPGRAPIFSPCGNAGGNPRGCKEDEHEKFGDCCGVACGAYAFGRNAEEYQWPNAPTTEWIAGSSQEVTWYASANHLGGYIYRLCKLPEGGPPGLTEECFQEGSLKFSGDKVWFTPQDTSERQELNATRLTVGTYPQGSEWSEVPIEHEMKGYLTDLVEVPDNVMPGNYVLSFRWDCMKTSQIWNVCANIKII